MRSIFLQYYVDVFGFLQCYVPILRAELNDSHYFSIFCKVSTVSDHVF